MTNISIDEIPLDIQDEILNSKNMEFWDDVFYNLDTQEVRYYDHNNFIALNGPWAIVIF